MLRTYVPCRQRSLRHGVEIYGAPRYDMLGNGFLGHQIPLCEPILVDALEHCMRTDWHAIPALGRVVQYHLMCGSNLVETVRDRGLLCTLAAYDTL